MQRGDNLPKSVWVYILEDYVFDAAHFMLGIKISAAR
jgi:hypothetical protein